MLSSPNLPFIIGNDICHIPRIRSIFKGRFGPQFVRRILRTEEIEHTTTARILWCIHNQNAQSSQASFDRAVEFMAGRFAAKEAVIKAHPHRRLTFQCIAILRATTNSSGGSVSGQGQGQGQESTIPFRKVSGPQPKDKTPQSAPLVALIKADENAQSDIYASVSISHDTDYATAVCLGINPASQLIWGSTMQNTVPKLDT
ncbi:hypothetical protein EV127DRAFT_23212 [Xylaria flabelliformis]|nr:hypothetical protein EV127DRAFT_23212 [Xylaria flabelliformis]